MDASHGEASGYEAMRKLLDLSPLPDGVFCYNDPVAIGAMKAIQAAGLRLPADICRGRRGQRALRRRIVGATYVG